MIEYINTQTLNLLTEFRTVASWACFCYGARVKGIEFTLMVSSKAGMDSIECSPITAICVLAWGHGILLFIIAFGLHCTPTVIDTGNTRTVEPHSAFSLPYRVARNGL